MALTCLKDRDVRTSVCLVDCLQVRQSATPYADELVREWMHQRLSRRDTERHIKSNGTMNEPPSALGRLKRGDR